MSSADISLNWQRKTDLVGKDSVGEKMCKEAWLLLVHCARPSQLLLEVSDTMQAARIFRGIMGFEPPSWHALARGDGNQKIISLWAPQRDGSTRRLLGVGLAFRSCPTNFLTTFSPQLFRVLLL